MIGGPQPDLPQLASPTPALPGCPSGPADASRIARSARGGTVRALVRKWRGPFAAVLLATGLASGLAACSTVGYYAQSVGGHLGVLRAARPIDDWLDDPATPQALRARLGKVREMRRFAAHELGLPDNRSYTTYADVKRPFVVWSVFATPELSLQLRQWCFPIVGCVTYRGYYDKDDADRYAQTFRERGDDVYVGGIPAYSTLGYTADPVLSTFIGFPEGEVARLIFHELAHQVVYLSGDTTFNESFAVAVEEEGVRRWFARGGDGGPAAVAYRRSVERKRAFIALLTRHRTTLQVAYARSVGADDKRAAKKAEFDALQADYAAAKREPSSALYDFAGYDRYFAQALNNANLAAVATYTQRVTAFAKLLDDQHGDLTRYYAAARVIAGLPVPERNARLDALAARGNLQAVGGDGRVPAGRSEPQPGVVPTTQRPEDAKRVP